MKNRIIALCYLLSAICLSAFAQGTAFTYQGQLQNNASPANGSYNLTFSLFNNSAGGTAVAGPVNTNGILVSNGLFTVTLDFGSGVWNGATNWLEIGVETNGGGSFTTLSPRQRVAPVPYAIAAAELSGAFTVQNNSTNGAPNLIGGSRVNYVSPGVIGATISGGGATNYFGASYSNSVTANFGTVGGGYDNTASYFSTIAGGSDNTASGGGAVVGGGDSNHANGNESAVVGGALNSADGYFSTVGGGYENLAIGTGAFIGGGGYDGTTTAANYAAGNASVIGGGIGNVTEGPGTTVGGGETNYVGDVGATVSGGLNNTVVGNFSMVGGGENNYNIGYAAVIAGGQFNTNQGNLSVVGGGENNYITGDAAVIAGGTDNTNLGVWSVVGGGSANGADAQFATVAGGGLNIATGIGVTISGGEQNSATNTLGTVGGGQLNQANGQYSTVGGGLENTASGGYATVPGGSGNSAAGDHSFAAGNGAQAQHNGTFVWADNSSISSSSSTAANQFLIRASGGVGINTATPGAALEVETTNHNGNEIRFGYYTGGAGNLIAGPSYVGIATGDLTTRLAILQGNGDVGIGTTTPAYPLQVVGTCAATTFVTTSDRNAKENFQPVNAKEILDQVAWLPVSRWNYKEDKTQTHIGPMAQDFYAAFDVGPDDKHIATVDEGGVALAAIQGLNEKVEVGSRKSERQIEELKVENAELKQQNDSLEKRLENLEQIMKSLNNNN